MTKPASTRSRLSPPASLTAIALLLAACGGGGGGDDSRSVSASPASSNATVSVDTSTSASAGSNANAATSSSQTGSAGNTTNTGSPGNAEIPANTASAPAANAPNNGSGTPQSDNIPPAPTEPGTNTVDADNKTSGAPIPAPVPLISAEGVRGDVLLAMFDQQACTSEFSPRRVSSPDQSIDSPDTQTLVEDTPPVLATASGTNSYTYDMSKWQQEGRHMPVRAPGYVYNCYYPDIRSYNAVKPGSYTFQVISAGRYHTFLTMRYYGDPRITRGVNEASISYDLNVAEDQVSIGTQVKVSLVEDFGYKASDISASDVPPGREITADYTGEAYTFRREALVPFGTMRQWQDGNGNFVQLMLIRGDSANEAKLCTNTNSLLVKRLQCVVWQIPADWSWGRELVGGRHHIVDDRSVYEGESGFLYWK